MDLLQTSSVCSSIRRKGISSSSKLRQSREFLHGTVLLSNTCFQDIHNSLAKPWHPASHLLRGGALLCPPALPDACSLKACVGQIDRRAACARHYARLLTMYIITNLRHSRKSMSAGCSASIHSKCLRRKSS